LTIVATSVALASSGCFVWKADYERDQAALRAELAQQKQDAATEREQLRAEQAKAVKDLQAAMDALNRAARKTGADLAVDLEKAQQEITTLKGQLEVVNHKLEAEEKAQPERDKKLDELYAWRSSRQKAIDAAEHPTDKTAIYQLALKKLDAGDTARARELLTEFLAKFKSDAYAPNAQYWLGESYYAERRFNDAIVEFQKVLKDWKSSEKTADALLKIGMSFQAQGDCQNAVLFFEEVIGSHRGSGAARSAKEKLGECKKKKGNR
jgi:tol-pal system protein YbgF